MSVAFGATNLSELQCGKTFPKTRCFRNVRVGLLPIIAKQIRWLKHCAKSGWVCMAGRELLTQSRVYTGGWLIVIKGKTLLPVLFIFIQLPTHYYSKVNMFWHLLAQFKHWNCCFTNMFIIQIFLALWQVAEMFYLPNSQMYLSKMEKGFLCFGVLDKYCVRAVLTI